MAAAYRKIDTIIPRPEQLGLPPAVVELYKKKRGLVLVTGPTGSGKSTTLASIINIANENTANHIITLEDPIEYIHRHKKSIVNQRELGMDTLSFDNALRAALREDPDIILFIDELHTLVGAGGAEGSHDAANIFKPALSRGEIHVIGATTLNHPAFRWVKP